MGVVRYSRESDALFYRRVSVSVWFCLVLLVLSVFSETETPRYLGRTTTTRAPSHSPAARAATNLRHATARLLLSLLGGVVVAVVAVVVAVASTSRVDRAAPRPRRAPARGGPPPPPPLRRPPRAARRRSRVVRRREGEPADHRAGFDQGVVRLRDRRLRRCVVGGYGDRATRDRRDKTRRPLAFSNASSIVPPSPQSRTTARRSSAR